jgi:hypothetical protein
MSPIVPSAWYNLLRFTCKPAYDSRGVLPLASDALPVSAISERAVFPTLTTSLDEFSRLCNERTLFDSSQISNLVRDRIAAEPSNLMYHMV